MATVYDSDGDYYDDMEDTSFMTPSQMRARRDDSDDDEVDPEALAKAMREIALFNTCDADTWAAYIDEAMNTDLVMKESDVIVNPDGLRNHSDNLFPYAYRNSIASLAEIEGELYTNQRDINHSVLANPRVFMANIAANSTPAVHTLASIDLAFDEKRYVEVDIDDVDELVGKDERPNVVQTSFGRWNNNDVFYQSTAGVWTVHPGDVPDQTKAHVAIFFFDKKGLYLFQGKEACGGPVVMGEDTLMAINRHVMNRTGVPLDGARAAGWYYHTDKQRATKVYFAPFKRNRSSLLKYISSSAMATQKQYQWISPVLRVFTRTFKEIHPLWLSLPVSNLKELNDPGAPAAHCLRNVALESESPCIKYLFRDDGKYLDFFLRFKARTYAGCLHNLYGCNCSLMIFGQRQLLGFFRTFPLHGAGWVKQLLLAIDQIFVYDPAPQGIMWRAGALVTRRSLQVGGPCGNINWALGAKRGKTGWAGLDIRGWEKHSRTGKLAVFVSGVTDDVHYAGADTWKTVEHTDAHGRRVPLRMLMPAGLDAHALVSTYVTSVLPVVPGTGADPNYPPPPPPGPPPPSAYPLFPVDDGRGSEEICPRCHRIRDGVLDCTCWRHQI